MNEWSRSRDTGIYDRHDLEPRNRRDESSLRPHFTSPLHGRRTKNENSEEENRDLTLVRMKLVVNQIMVDESLVDESSFYPI